MPTIRPLLFCLILFCVSCAVHAQSVEGLPVRTGAFPALLAEIEPFGNSAGRRAEAASNWVQRQSLSTLTWQDRVGVLPLLESPDGVDKTNMSVRWTGQISAPADGQYTFEQFRTFHTDGKVKLWIDDLLVLDSFEAASSEDGVDFDEFSFRSIPVALIGVSVSVLVSPTRGNCTIS